MTCDANVNIAIATRRMVVQVPNATTAVNVNHTRGGDMVQNNNRSSHVNVMGNITSDGGVYVNGFEGYYPQTSVDPGSSFLVATILFCVLSQLLLPWLVILDARHRRRKKKKKKEHASAMMNESMDVQLEVQEEHIEVFTKDTCVTPFSGLSKPEKYLRFHVRKGQRCRRGGRNWIAFGDGISYRHLDSSTTEDEEDSEAIEMMPSNLTSDKAKDTFIDKDSTHLGDTKTKDNNGETNHNLCCDERTWWKPSMIFGDGYIYGLSRSKPVILDVTIPIVVDDNKLCSPSLEDKGFSSNDYASPSKHNRNDDDDAILNLCCGPNALWKPATISQNLRYVMNLAKYDKETRSILKLAIPYSFSAVMDAIFEAIGIGIVGHYLGTDALIAYSVVDVIISISSELVGGVIDTEASLCSHAIGAGNNMLTGQYVQLAVIIYCVCQIPFIFFWSFTTERILLWMDFDEHIAVMGQEYARVAIWADVYEGIVEAFNGLLEVAGYERWISFMCFFEGLVEILLLFLLVSSFDVTLVDLAYMSISVGLVFFIGNVWFTTYYKKWTRPYMHGMIGALALKNRTALCVMINTAAPLSVGALVANGEWEILTIFAAALGPAEVATWAILGSIWDIFEASTEGIGDAAEVRCAHHLGKHNPEMAKTSSFKSILFATSLSVVVTSIFFILGDFFPVWFTTDSDLQRMLRDLVPLVGIGNVTMTFGMVSWALVGAQGRYALATFVSFVSSWCITIPLSAIFVFGLNVDLQGVTSAVVIGYSCTGSVLTFILLRSDWEHLSDIVQNLNAMTGEVLSDSDDDDSESSSSSSSSSDSDDEDDSMNAGNNSEIEILVDETSETLC